MDDEASVRKALERLLATAQLRTEAFENCSSFLASLTRRHPDCLILDVYLPGMSGLELMEAMRAQRRLPTIVITGHDDPGMRRRCLDAGATAYLCKPFDRDALLEAIGRALA